MSDSSVRRPGLAAALAIVTALLVTVAVAAVSVFGIQTLKRLAEAEALARVELGLSTAREAVRQSSEDLVTASIVLGERPTLQRLLQSSETEPLVPYLTRYCDGAAFDGCAVVRGRNAVVTIGQGLDWSLILAAAAEQSEGFFVTGAAPGVALLGGQAPAIGHDGVWVLAVRRMDGTYAARLTERVGLEVQVIDFASFRAGQGEFGVLDSDALARSETVSTRIDARGVYAASQPLAAATGETIALLHTLLPADRVMSRVNRMTNRILLMALIVAVIATTAGVLIGRIWLVDVERLTEAARRLAGGDLATAMPVTGGPEISVLAHTMEEMRRNLVDLTSELRRREAEAQAVLSGIVEGVYAVDESRRIRFLNSQAEKLLNISSEDATGRFCGDVLKPLADDQGRRPCDVACPILRARRKGSADAIERIVPREGGRQRRVVIASAAPTEGLQVQVLRDETELEAVRRTRDTVLANISHEFRTPLAAQLASIELLSDGLGKMPIEAQRELVASVERGGQRLTWLIDNLLESVRIESGQLAIRSQELRLADVVQAARDLIEPLITQRGQQLDVASLAELPVIQGDEQRLTQVVVNLLANASKFAPEGSTIRIGGTVTAPETSAFGSGGGGIGSKLGSIHLWIDDEGPGPDDVNDDALFEQFHRSGGEDPDESGLGLGLYIVRSIVERHGGRVSLSRTDEGRTRALVTLPRGEKR